MKFMLLIYNNPEALAALSEEEKNEVIGEVTALMAELTESGEYIGGEGLGHPSEAKTVRLVGGVPATTDGPFVEAKEALAGYVMVDVDGIERAIDIAARWPDAKWGAMEVRSVMGGA